MRFVDDRGVLTESYPYNVNGSPLGIIHLAFTIAALIGDRKLAKFTDNLPVKLSPEDLAGLESEIEQITEQREPSDEALTQEEAALRAALAQPSTMDALCEILAEKWKAVCETQRRVEAVLLTHAHLDHCWTFPFFLANRFEDGAQTCRLFADPVTLVLKMP